MARIIIALSLLPAIFSLKCNHSAGVSDIVYDERGVATGSNNIDPVGMGVYDCDTALDRCVIFTSMMIDDYMKLDVAAKDSKMTNYIKDHNGKVYGKTCMSQKDCYRIQAQKADVCTGAFKEGTVPCYCTTDTCTGSGAGLSIILPVFFVLTYYVSY
ncbi:hypothetical protein PMAYCL1PPCAC_04659 [Pristionchus mayeri]|uniref:Uncharacterized protein n=1 Tax=Pristionchus mayeri TaxID=1317129 RepID=A0AAN4Z6Y4_9BILA|nr:hypothetical protein PMAYCL1PPCAC_04659 [Pristionchus mayeri]